MVSGRKNFTGPPVAADEVEHDGTTIGGGRIGRVMTDRENGSSGSQEGKTHPYPLK